MQLTDLHLGEEESKDRVTLQFVRDLIQQEKPDFIAVVSDLVSGQNAFVEKTVAYD